MSILIEMEEETARSEAETLRFLKENLMAFFRAFNECRSMEDTGKQLCFSMKASERTLRLSTLWNFDFSSSLFNLSISFYNRVENQFLRAETDRMRIETSILIRLINSDKNPYTFKIDPSEGRINVCYCIDWGQFYNIFQKKQQIKALVKSIMIFIRKYNQLFLFLEPVYFQKEEKHMSARSRINKYRYIIKQRRNMRNNVQGCLGDLIRMKEGNQILNLQQMNELQNFYMHNIIAFKQSQFGLSEEQMTKQNLIKYIKEINKNDKGMSAANIQKSMANKNQDPIVYGLKDLQEESDNEKPYSVEGAHSLIYRKKFNFGYTISINSVTVNGQFSPDWSDQIIYQRGQLTYKVCNTSCEGSINSFRNQLAVLKYLKNFSCPYIAKYYLKIQENWTQKDVIYMKSYKQNLHHLFKTHQNICLETKLFIAYGIAKGLCFLFSKRILHRDFKAQNILVDQNLTPKIIDFGSCCPHYNTANFKISDERLLTTPGLHIHFSDLPQSYNFIKEKMCKKAYEQHPLFDVYGFGRILSYIFFGSTKPPIPETLLGNPHFQFLEHILFLIDMCMKVDPDERPSCGQATTFLGVLKQLMKNVVIIDEDQDFQVMQLKQ